MTRKSIALVLVAFLTGCVSYQSKVYEARSLIEDKKFFEAESKLQPLAFQEDGDQLVYLLDYAVAAQLNGNYRESNNALIKADKLVEQLDYHSVSRVTGSLLTSEEVMQYKGDTFEKIFLNAYLAMNFLQLGKLDDALVEARRMNEKYIKYRLDEEKKYKQNVFGKYLSALIWEADGKYDDSYIAYNEAYELDPNLPTIKEDLIRVAKLSRRTQAYNKWKKEFPEIKENPNWYNKNYGQVIVVHQVGWGPRKTYNPSDVRFPILRSYRVATQSSQVHIQNFVTNEVQTIDTKTLYNVESAAISTLADDYATIAGKRVAGTVAKAVAADQVRQKNQLLGDLIYIAMHVSDKADLRQWSTLPQKINFQRVYLNKGNYKLELTGEDHFGAPTTERLEIPTLQIKPNKIQFIVWRTVN